jgi:hypothetical protein
MKVMLRSAIVLVSLAALVPSPASAQFPDHLKCHKIKDTLKLRETADLLTAADPNYAANGCTITKATQFCVPVAKQNVQPPPVRPDITGQGLATDYICYKLKCPGGLGDQVATDQFGTRTLSHVRTDMLCVPAVKGTGPTITTTTVSSTTTSTSLPAGTCCGAQQIVLTTGSGTAKFGVITAPPEFFPGGGTITIDAAPADPFPSCGHDAIVPAAGFSLPAFCDNGLFFTHKIITSGCTSGGTDGSGRVWDGVAACADANVSKSADSRDGVCDPDLSACTSGPFGNVLGDVDATRGGACDPSGLNTRIDIPATMVVWSDVDGQCPDPDGQYDSGVDSLIEQDPIILTLTTGTATAVFADKSGPACFIEGGSAGPVGPQSISGAPASGPCCQVGQTATLAAETPIFGGAFPFRDYQLQLSIPATVSSCGAWPGPAACTLPGGCLD